jgi:ribulose-bisphosphate carboxylase large chain
MQKAYINRKLKNLQGGKYVLTVFKLIPKKGYDLLDVASEAAAESSTGTMLRVKTATAFADRLNALVYKIDKKKNLVWIAYPWRIFDRGGNCQNILTYIAGNIYGMSSVKGMKLLDVWFPPKFLKEFEGPNVNIDKVRKYLKVKNRPILGTIVKPKIGLKPDQFAKAAQDFWMGGGDFVKFDEPQADQDFCPFNKTVDKIRKVMDKVEKQTGKKKIMSFNISSPDFDTMVKRADYVKKMMKPGSYCFLVDGITAGWTAVQTARRKYPNVFIHFHRAGHGAFTRDENPFGFSVLVLSKFARLSGASGMHTGTAGIGKMAGNKNEDIVSAHMIQKKKAKGHFFEQDWGKIKPTTPIASGGLDPLKLRPFINAMGNTDFITTMGGGVHGHPKGTEKGATALVQACEAWQKKVPLKKYAKDHEELALAIEQYS